MRIHLHPTGMAAAAALGVLAEIWAAPAAAADKEVTFAYQDMVVPFRVIMESVGDREGHGLQDHLAQVRRRRRRHPRHGVGQRRPRGSRVEPHRGRGLAGPADRALLDPRRTIADAEQLVARDGSGVTDVKSLKGHTVATVPFRVDLALPVLMYALQKAGLGAKDVKVLNMRPPEIAAAWERGDIDATFIWDPVLAKVKANGKVIDSAAKIAEEGRPTFDGLVVDKAWADGNKPFMVEFVKLLSGEDARYAADKASWTPGSDPVKAVAKWTGADPADVPAGMAAYRFPTLSQQASATWLGGGATAALKNTADIP